MPPTSLSTTPLFQHLLSSLPSLRGQIKDAVTASMKQWLLDIRNVSAQIGQLALEAMETRTRRWRSRRDKDPMLKSSRVGSAVETITYEKTECMVPSYDSLGLMSLLVVVRQTMYWIMTSCRSTSSRYTSVFTSTVLWTRWTRFEGHTRPIERYFVAFPFVLHED